MGEVKRQLRVGTLNVGRGDFGPIRDLAHTCHALALQELSDRDELVQRLRQDPELRVVRRKVHPGQAAVGLVWRPSVLRLVVQVHRLLVPVQTVNPSTGPERMKAKWLVGGTFEHRHTSALVTVGSTHRVAGQTPQGDTARDTVALHHAARVRREMRETEGYKIVGGDWNSWPDDDSLRPLRQAGWTCDQLEDKRLGTHGHWAPDHVWWDQVKGLDYHSHRVARDVGSDHRPLVATFQL